MVEKELKFRMLGGVYRMVRFFPTSDCGRIPRLWSQPRVLELLGRCLVIIGGHLKTCKFHFPLCGVAPNFRDFLKFRLPNGKVTRLTAV